MIVVERGGGGVVEFLSLGGVLIIGALLGAAAVVGLTILTETLETSAREAASGQGPTVDQPAETEDE